MSHNGTLNISRDDVGEVRRVFILKNGGSETAGCDGQGVAPLSRTPSISNTTTQHGGSDSGGINGNCDSDNVINGMLRAGEEDVDPTSDLGADLQHIEEWLKTRSDSLSSFDFDSEIKPSEIDISDLFNLKSSVQFHVGGQDYGLVFSKDGASDAGTSSSTLPSQFTFPDMGDSLSGSGSRRNSFTKKLETLMQVDKGLFEELLLTDQNKKCGAKKIENMPSLPTEDRGLFEELLLPGAQEEWARHAQELLLAVTMEKKETGGSGSTIGEGESLPEPMECSDPLSSSTQDASTSQESTDELDLMVRNIQPIKLMSPQEIENMASRPLGFDETPVKAESQRNREVTNQIEEDFNFHPFGTRGCDDSSTLPQDILASPNSEVDSKLSSILAMDASNDTLEIESSSASDMLENLNKTPPKPERSISPGTFLVKLEPKENQVSQDKSSPNTFSLSQQTSTVMPPPLTTLSTATSHAYSTSVPISILDLRLAAPPVSSSAAAVPTNATPTTTAGGAQLPRPAFILRPLITPGQQIQQQAPQPNSLAPKTIGPPKESTPLTLTPLKVVAVQPPNKPASGLTGKPPVTSGAVLTTAKGIQTSLVTQKTQIDSSPPSTSTDGRASRIPVITSPDKSQLKNEGVGLSLRPGAPPTMVSVPSVLDTLSASSLVSGDLLQTSAHSPSSSTTTQNDEDVNDENPEMCIVSDEVADKALEELGIHIDSLQCEPSPQGGKRWLCPIKGCCKHFPKLSSLKVHLLSHNGIRPYKCSYENCDWAFYTWYKLKRHIETHLKRRDFACSEPNCNRRFTTVYNLNTHLRLHQRPKCWMCSLPECTKAFHTRRELEVHMKTHKDVEAPYKCGVDGCSKSYFTPNSLTSHMRSHHKEEELRCQWTGCGKKFDKPCRLKAHMRVHTGQRPFVCTYEGCNWSFQSASKLSRHQRKHTNDRKFTCTICQKSFLRSEHLKGHLLIHTGVRNFQCPVEHCNAKFTAKSSLYVHLKKHEGKTKENNNKVTYHCPIDTCDKSYNSKFNLRQHMLKNHTILTTDTSQLDYITLLGEKDLMMDHLLPLTAGGSTSASATLDPNVPASSLAPSSHAGDTHATLLSSIELINGDIGTDGTNIPPIIVMEGRAAAEAIEGMDVGMPDTLMGNTAGGNGESEVESLDMPTISKDSVPGSGGSARTDVVGNILRSRRARKRQQMNLAKKMAELGCHISGTDGVVSFTNDVVLSASAVTLPATSHLQSTLLQDDAVTSELYQETLMGHDLLSDPTTDPQSTINLRDLE
ncbi:Zinc finger X-linked protein ZXDB [Penaeus vannamei]|uniref:Zinc finger X-linked protein ZXDB n=1 Tax=Penaeus vannamei TaxID=6689 RepID=A0A3R7Q0L1_PENVA|nr:Zinc finger X-linked protein ZXDB [Penaeus vannamei]